MIDDPNLHATTYGFLSFKDLIVKGRRHGFHTALATVPLDQYYVNRSAAELLRDNPDTVSLLVHGNNHTHCELGSCESPERRLALMRVALARIERLERRTGVVVSRVMSAPHGACSEDMMRTLGEAGFEAACISHGSIQAANGASEWTAGLGADPTTVIQGLPVIPRVGLGGGTEAQALVSVYLGQPLVAVGHHWDFRDGAGVLLDAARSLQALGEVSWSDMTTIARGNYHWKIDGATLRVRSFSRRFRVRVPDGVTEVAVEFSSIGGAHATLACETVPDGRAAIVAGAQGNISMFSVLQPCVLEVSARPSGCGERGVETIPRTPVKAVVRRGLCEVRDRLMPLMPHRRSRT